MAESNVPGALARESSGDACARAARGWPWMRTAQVLLLLLAASLPYVPALNGQYIYDDVLYVRPPCVVSDGGLHRIWFTGEPHDYWPVDYSLCWLQWHLFAGKMFGYHVVSVALHALACLVFWAVLARLDVRGAWLAVLLFAVHPVNVGSVAYVAQQKTLLAALFGGLSTWAFVAYLDRRTPKSYAVALVCCILSIMSKTLAVALPPVLVLLARWRRGRLRRSDLISTAPFFLVALILGIVGAWFKEAHDEATTAAAHTWLEGLVAVSWACWAYLEKAILPIRLLFFYPTFDINLSSPWAYLPGVAIVVGLVGLLCVRRRWAMACWVCLLFFLINLAPSLYFKAYLRFWQFEVADYYQYPGLLGILVLAAAGLGAIRQRWPRTGWPLTIATGMIVVLLFVLSWRQAAIYQSEEIACRHTLAHNPNSALAHFDLGKILLEDGRYAESAEHSRRAVELNPQFADAIDNLARALLAMGQVQAAWQQAEAMMRVSGDGAETYSLLALFAERKDPAVALAYHHKAIARAPELLPPRRRLAEALIRQGRVGEAIEVYQQALKLDPANVQILADLDRARTLVQPNSNEPAGSKAALPAAR